MAKRSRISNKDSEFDPYIRDTTAVLEAGTPTGAVRLGITTTQFNDWKDYRDKWIILYPKYTNSATRTKTITEAKNKLKDDFRAFAEKPLKLIEASDNITSDDRGTFNLPEPDRTKTPRGPIADRPYGKLTGTGGGIMEVRVRRTHDGTRSSMHELADVVEFRYMVVEKNEPPVPPPTPTPDTGEVPTPEECNLSMSSKTAFWRINLGSPALGKRVIGFVRWVNLTNPANNSGWSDLLTTIIS